MLGKRSQCARTCACVCTPSPFEQQYHYAARTALRAVRSYTKISSPLPMKSLKPFLCFTRLGQHGQAVFVFDGSKVKRHETQEHHPDPPRHHSSHDWDCTQIEVRTAAYGYSKHPHSQPLAQKSSGGSPTFFPCVIRKRARRSMV